MFPTGERRSAQDERFIAPSTATVYKSYQGNSYLFAGNAPVCRGDVRELPIPGSVPDNWRSYFDALQTCQPQTAPTPAMFRTCPSSTPLLERAKQGGTRGAGQR